MSHTSRRPIIRRAFLVCLAVALLPVLAGCGGGNLCCSSEGGNGNVDVNIRSASQTTNTSQPGAPR